MTDDDRSQELTTEVETMLERASDRRERLVKAYEEIRTMDADLVEARKMVEHLQQHNRELRTLVSYLDQRCKDLDKDRLTYAGKAISLARVMASIWHLCEEGNELAGQADVIEGIADLNGASTRQ